MTTGLTTPICELDDATLKQYHAAILTLDPVRPPRDGGLNGGCASRHDRAIREFDRLLAPALNSPENYSLLIAAIKHTLLCEIDRRTQARIIDEAFQRPLEAL